jgi:predicted short-subunit dehydrogenase-like oxidoreductase (DUF2520 family)
MANRKPKKKRYHVTIIGAGRAGSATARLLHGAGHRIECIVSKSEASARVLAKELRVTVATTTLSSIPSQTDLIIIATGDDTVATVARSFAQTAQINFRGVTVAHISGALTRDALISLQKKGATTWGLHPAFPFASRNVPAKRLHGIGWAVECAPKEWLRAKNIVESFHGVPVRIDPKNKILYHAGCSVASNFLVVLIDSAMRLFQEAGISPRDARKLLQPLVAETLNNVWSDPDIPVSKKLTGPVARGDAETLRKHLTSLKKFGEIEQMFRALTRSALTIAKKNKNIPPEKLRMIDRVVNTN